MIQKVQKTLFVLFSLEIGTASIGLMQKKILVRNPLIVNWNGTHMYKETE